jgi:hypothetical protein
MSRFLRFVVEETAAGRSAGLKEYVVALRVFDKAESFDPAVDPAVRVEASKLRAKLARYQETEGRHDPLVIEIPKGHYAAKFSARAGSGASEPGKGRPRSSNHGPCGPCRPPRAGQSGLIQDRGTSGKVNIKPRSQNLSYPGLELKMTLVSLILFNDSLVTPRRLESEMASSFPSSSPAANRSNAVTSATGSATPVLGGSSSALTAMTANHARATTQMVLIHDVRDS